MKRAKDFLKRKLRGQRYSYQHINNVLIKSPFLKSPVKRKGNDCYRENGVWLGLRKAKLSHPWQSSRLHGNYPGTSEQRRFRKGWKKAKETPECTQIHHDAVGNLGKNHFPTASDSMQNNPIWKHLIYGLYHHPVHPWVMCILSNPPTLLEPWMVNVWERENTLENSPQLTGKEIQEIDLWKRKIHRHQDYT